MKRELSFVGITSLIFAILEFTYNIFTIGSYSNAILLSAGVSFLISLTILNIYAFGVRGTKPLTSKTIKMDLIVSGIFGLIFSALMIIPFGFMWWAIFYSFILRFLTMFGALNLARWIFKK